MAARWKAARLVSAGAAAVIAGGTGLAFAAATSHRTAAQPFQGQYAVSLHQRPPITAAGFDSHGTCPGIPPTKDGWHFVLPHTGPGNVVHRFVELTVDFDKGNDQVDVRFTGNDTQAYVSSVAGATLLSATAIVETQAGSTLLEWFNLGHTCPASPLPPGPETPTPTPPTPETPTPVCPPGKAPVAAGEQPVAPSPRPEDGEPATLYPPAPGGAAAPAPSPVTTCFAVTG